MDDIEKLTDHIEYLFLKDLVRGMRNGIISDEQAQQYAKDFLPVEPFQTYDDAKQKIDAYFSTHPQFTKLKEYVDAYHEDQQTDQKIAAMRKHLQENNLDEALKVAKG